MPDLFDQLADLDVPPPPVAFNRDLHQRLNQSLTTQHMVDLGLQALPTAAMEFVRAVIGLLTFTVTGKYPDKKKQL